MAHLGLLGAGSGSVVGFIAGATVGGGIGGIAGLVIGASLGGMAGGTLGRAAERTARSGKARGPRTFLCTVRNELAECTIERDAETGEWLEVVTCSLNEDPNHVTCEKKCLGHMNDH